MQGRRKLRGSGSCAPSGGLDAMALLQAAGCLLGRVVAPAVLVALAVALTGHVGELVRERALALVLAVRRQRHAGAGALEQTVGDEALEVRRERFGGHGEEAGELLLGRRVGDALG